MNTKYSYIRKTGYYYRPNSRGYTEDKKQAGIFLTTDAERHKMNCEELEIVPINIDEHNASIRKGIEDLEKNLIENEDLTIRVSPFTALTVYTLSSLFKRRLEIEPECARILQAVNDYEDKVFAVVTEEQAEDAMLEKEIHQALNNIKE